MYRVNIVAGLYKFLKSRKKFWIIAIHFQTIKRTAANKGI